MAPQNENLTVEQATKLVFEYSENLAQKVMEENSERLQGVYKHLKSAMKETIKEFYIKEFIKELRKRMEEL